MAFRGAIVALARAVARIVPKARDAAVSGAPMRVARQSAEVANSLAVTNDEDAPSRRPMAICPSLMDRTLIPR